MGHFSIKDIELLTGIKAHTLRIWEQRYNIPRPQRTDSNIRFYSDDDLRLLLNISLLNQHGHKISEISRLDEKSLRELAVNYSLRSEKHSAHIQSLIASMINLDESAFERILNKSILQYGLEATMTEVVFPLMASIGMMWQTGTINPAYEHFISNLIRQKLIVAIDGQTNSLGSGKKFLLFLPEGESHELGLLFGSFMIRNAGHATLYLGQSLPISDLKQISERYTPDFLLTSLTTGFPQPMAESLLKEMQAYFPSATVLVTGRFFVDHVKQLPESIKLIRNPDDLKMFL